MVTFQEVPTGVRVPFVFIEIDPSRAQVGPRIQEYRTLNVGQRLSTGTVAADTPFLATSADQVGEKAGFGSILHGMAIAYFAANNVSEAWFIGLDDDGGGTAGTQEITFTGTATENGTIYLYVAGRRITAGVTSGDTASDVAAAVNAAIAASSFAAELPVTASVLAAVVTLTARNAGTQGNAVDVRLNHQQGEAFPAGIGGSVAAAVVGATDPSVAGAIAALAATQYHTIAVGLNDAATIAAFESELADRFMATEQLEGHAFYSIHDTHGNLVTAGSARNSPHSTIIGVENPLSTPWEYAASAMGLVSRHGQADPARPFQTLTMPGIVGPNETEAFTLTERDLLLKNGIATVVLDEFGVSRLERMITTFQTLSTGAASEAFLDVNTLLTLSFLRYDARTRFASTFPRFKLADDGTRFGSGQAVMTPRVARAFFLSVFRGWEELGLVENFEQFEQDLLVERNTQDPNRLDVVLRPDLINQLRVLGAAIQFIL